MTDTKTRYTFRVSAEDARAISEHREAHGCANDSEAIRALLQAGLSADEGCVGTDGRKTLHSTLSKITHIGACLLVLQAIALSSERADLKNLSTNELFILARASADAYVRAHGKKDIDSAIERGRHALRKYRLKCGTIALLDYMAALNSQVIFNALDTSDLETWISSMFAYRRGQDCPSRQDFDYEVALGHLVAILSKMGVKIRDAAQEKFGSKRWTWTNESGWTYLTEETLINFEPVYVDNYTHVFDPLDPHPENYFSNRIVPDEVYAEHIRWCKQIYG